MCTPRAEVCRGCGDGPPVYAGWHRVHHTSPDGLEHYVHQCEGRVCRSDGIHEFDALRALDWPAVWLSMADDDSCFWCDRLPKLTNRMGRAALESMHRTAGWDAESMRAALT